MTDWHIYGIRGEPPFYAQLYPCIALVSRGKLLDWWIFKHYNGAHFNTAYRPGTGMIVTKVWYSEQPRTGEQQGWRSVFYDAVKNWQSFDDETKRYYNQRAKPKGEYGYHRYLTYYLKANFPMIIYWEPLKQSASQNVTIPAYMNSDYFGGAGRIRSVTDYPASPPYGAIRYRSDLKKWLGFKEDAGWSEIGAPFDLFAQYLDVINWRDSELYTKTVSGVSDAQFRQTIMNLSTGTLTGNSVFVHDNEKIEFNYETTKIQTFEFPLFNLHSVTNQTIYLHLTEDTGSPPDEVMYHFGFKIVNGDLYASSGDEEEQEITDTGVNLSTGYQNTRLKIEFKAESYVKFYVNDVLKVTHTTHIPTQVYFYRNFGVVTNENKPKGLSVGRLLIVKEY